MCVSTSGSSSPAISMNLIRPPGLSTRRTSASARGTNRVRPLPVQVVCLSRYPNHPSALRLMSPSDKHSADPLAETPAHVLGGFIRVHRERLSPMAVGLPPGPRRRTPELRREEVAGTVRRQSDLVYVDRTRIRGSNKTAQCPRLPTRSRALPSRCNCRGPNGRICSNSPPSVIPPNWTRHRSMPLDAPAALLQTVSLIGASAFRLCARPPVERAVLERACGRTLPRLARCGTRPQPAHLHVADGARTDRRLGNARAAPGCRIPRRFDSPSQRSADVLSAASDAFARFWASQDVFEREGGEPAFSHPARVRVVFNQITFKPAHREDLKLVILVGND